MSDMDNETRYFVDDHGNYLGAYGPGTQFPPTGIMVPVPPDDARKKWDGKAWQVPEELERDTFKRKRADLVASITVTTASGRTFDGDETSQNRMARAIVVLNTKPVGATVQWVLADNTVVDVERDELTEALTLAGLRQTELWVQA